LRVASIVADFVPETINVDEKIKEIKAKQKPAKSAPAKPEVTKRMLSKVARAYRKANIKGGGTESDHTAFVHTLLNAGVPILERSSSRICRSPRVVQNGRLHLSKGKVPKFDARHKRRSYQFGVVVFSSSFFQRRKGSGDAYDRTDE
jgi:hypothetical protein